MERNSRRLLILGAGRGQVGLYKAAREMGISTIAGTMPDNNPPCIPLADEVCYMNILDPDEVEEKTKDLQFDGVATCCLDKGLKALGRLCDTRGVIGFSENSAELCNDKSLMKAAFVLNGVRTAPYRKIDSIETLISSIAEIGGYPVIVKATDLAGSKGIYKAENEEQAIRGFAEAMAMTRKGYVLVEKFLVGEELGAQAFVSAGKVLFVMPHGDILYKAATNVPVGHYVPYECSENLMKKIEVEAKKAIKAVGLDNCAVNLDFIIVDGVPYVLELSGRIGANCLPELVSIHYGINYYKMVIASALGMPIENIWNSRSETNLSGMSQMIISPSKSGILESLTYDDASRPEYIYDLTLFAQKGQEVRAFSNSADCLAQVVVKGDSMAACKEYMKAVENHLALVIR